MNLHQVRVFLKVADTLHFGHAAQQLGVTQPSISRVLSGLERQVGKDLFDRTSRSIRLTPAGKAFLQPARLMLHHAETALRAAKSGVEEGIDTLRVGLMIGSAQPAVGKLIRGFKDLHPETLVSFHKADESTLGKQLTSGEIDVVVAWDAFHSFRFIPEAFSKGADDVRSSDRTSPGQEESDQPERCCPRANHPARSRVPADHLSNLLQDDQGRRL